MDFYIYIYIIFFLVGQQNISPLTFWFWLGHSDWGRGAKRETKADMFVGVLLKVRQEWVKQEGVETDDLS